MISIGSMLCKSRLVKLLAANNEAGDNSAIQFAFALKDSNCNLQYLDLANNEITDKAGQEIAIALTGNQKLHYLNLSNNELTKETS